MARESVLFLRNCPPRFNLGDFLCTPIHYFDFGVNEHQSRLFLKAPFKTILGGGAFNDLGVGQDVDFKRTVAWGVGSSHHGATSVPTPADDLPYLLYGVRDPDAVKDDSKILPCVTCLHPVVQLPPGDKTNIFLNFHKKITDISQAKSASIFRDSTLNLYTNNLSELAFMKAFAESGKIITNSFHVAYWSLLSGRQVAIIGYSSKFRSLLRLVGLQGDGILQYDVSSQSLLINSMAEIVGNGEFHSLKNFNSVRQDCIGRNIKFAQKCVDIGFVPGFSLKPQNKSSMVGRMIKYQPIQLLRTIRDRE